MPPLFDKGEHVNTTAHNAIYRKQTGCLAALRALRTAQGSGASSASFSGRRLAALLTVAPIVLLSLLLSISPAGAAESHAYAGSFGSSGSGAGQVELVPPKFDKGVIAPPERAEMVVGGSGLAVDQVTGDVYVADTGNHRVDEFSPSGVFVRAWGWGVASGASESQVCTNTCLVGIPGSAPGQFTAPTFVAVDNTSGGASDVYVADSATGIVQKFSPSGGLITSWGGVPAPGQAGGFEHVEGIAVKTEGAFIPEGSLLVQYFPDFPSTGGNTISALARSSGDFESTIGKFGRWSPIGMAIDPAGRLYEGNEAVYPVEIFQTSICSAKEGTSSDPCFFIQNPPGDLLYIENFLLDKGPATGVAVDPVGEDVFVAHYNTFNHSAYVSGYDSQGNLLESDIGGNGEITETAGLAVYGADSNVYVADPGAGRIEIFAPGGPRESLSVTRAGSALGSVVSEPAGVACPFNCTAGFPENEEVTLTATAPAHSTFVGWSGGGCSGTGPCRLTLTAAAAVTAVFTQDRPLLGAVEASAVTRNTATLTGSVDPEADASSCRFEYGPTTAYGAEAPCSTLPLSGGSPVPVSGELWELAAASTYHFRLVSANTGGTSYGPDRTFTTVSESCATDVAVCPPAPTTSLPLTTAIEPVVGTVGTKTTTRALTAAQKLAKALQACRKERHKSARLLCEKQARARYAPSKKTKKKRPGKGGR
jgi:DNA-binding beta-propeller fold protein YncE